MPKDERRRARRALWALVPLLALAATLGVGAGAAAHAYLDEAAPAADAMLAEPPRAVTLRFTEPVEVRASIFKVYPLSPDEDPLRLRAQAARLVEEVLQLRGDEAHRADVGVEAPGREAAEIRIVLKDDLPPGPYVVMWRVLSIDTHITWGHYVFTYAPAAE